MASEINRLKEQKEKLNKEMFNNKTNLEIFNLKREKENALKNNNKLNKDFNLLKKSNDDLQNKYKNEKIE